MGTTLESITMSKTFVIVLACLVAAVVAQETILMADFNLLRSVTNATANAKTLAASPLDVAATTGVVGLSLSADGKTLYGANQKTNKILAFDLSEDTIASSVLAGSDTAAGAIGTTLNENSGSSAAFAAVTDMAMGADGNLYVLDGGAFQVIRKVTPAGVVTHFAGAAFANNAWTKNAAGDGVATVAGFTALTKIAASSQGGFMVVDSGVLKEVAADGTVTTKSGATASPGVNGVGTSASFDVVNDMSFSTDGNFLYVAEAKIATPNLVETAFGDATNFVRKVDLSNFGVSTLAGNTPTAAGKSADGTGTSVFFSALSSLSVSSSDDIFVTEVCDTGSVVRKISPDGTTATHAGDLTAAGCNQPKVVTDLTKSYNKDGMGTAAGFNYGYDSVVVQEVCGKFFPIGVEAELDECEDLSGTVKQVKAKGNLKVKKALIIQSLFVILAGGSVQADAPITVQGPLEMSGNGTMEINDNDVVADEVTLSEEGTYQILVARAVPGLLRSKGIARIKGAFVLAVAATYDFAVGASVSVLEFANFEGAFDKVFFVKMRSRSSRALLQNSGASNANVACSGTSCQATGVADAGVDDDDEVPFIVALIIVSALLFLAIALAIYFASTGGAPSFGKKNKTEAPAATAYGAPEDQFSLSTNSSSSSSTYEFDYAF